MKKDIVLPVKLEELRNVPRWVCWKYAPDVEKPERMRKLPMDPITGGYASSTDPNTWSTFPVALKKYGEVPSFDGVGFVLGNGFFGVDLDHVRNPETGEITGEAREIVNLLASYTEVSPSGTGLHTLCKGKKPDESKCKSEIKGDGYGGKIRYEVYDSGRYFTFTGNSILKSEIHERNREVSSLLDKYISGAETAGAADPSKEQKISWNDYILGDSKLSRLWNGDTSDYGFDSSSADIALVLKLLDYTGCDIIKTDKLFRQSKLYREKWDEKHSKTGETYGEITINSAVRKFKFRSADGVMPADAETKELSLDNITSFAEIEEKPVEWLIPGYIPKGSISVVAGTGGTRKSSVLAQLAAAVASGGSWFVSDYNMITPQKVLFLSGEDDPSRIMKKRIGAYSTIQDNILTVDPSAEEFKHLITTDAFFGKVIDTYKPALVVLDPIQSFLSEKVDMTRRNAMRTALKPMLEYGAKYGTAFIIVVHTNKRDSAFGRNRISDSSDIWDIARAVFITGETDQPQQWYISNEKNSYAELAQTAVFTVIDDRISVIERNNKRDRYYVQQQGSIQAEQPYPALALGEAKDFILDYLEDQEAGNHVTYSEIRKAAAASGIAEATLRRAKTDLISEKLIDSKRISKGDKSGVQLEIWKI